MKKTIKIIDCTPTWEGLHPIYSEWINSGTVEQKQLVIDELKKLCILADEVNNNKEVKRLLGVK